MTVTSNTTRNDYVAGNNQNVYDYTFQLNEAGDVTVYLDGVVQTLNVHYTVQNVGVGTGGTITFTLVDSGGNPIYPTPGSAISIVMAMDLDRDTDYQANGVFLASEVNNDYDRLWLATNQQQTAINRSLRLQDDDIAGASPSMELPLKDDRKGKVLAFDSVTGEPIAGIPIENEPFTLAETLAEGNTTGGNDIVYDTDDKAVFGSGAVGPALEIYTDGTGSGRIENVGLGSMVLKAPNYVFRNDSDDSILAMYQNRSAAFKDNTGNTRMSVGNGKVIINDEARVYGSLRFDELATNTALDPGGSGGPIIDEIFDEDNMASDSATGLATQQSIKAYVDAHPGTIYTAGTGINISGSNVISNTAPDQTVALTGGTGISTSGTYPNFTITNDSPDQTVSLTGAGTTTVSGTYPNFTITGTAGSETLAQTLALGNTTSGNDIAFGDNDKATFGANTDLEIYSDASSSFINELGPGGLVVQGANVNIKNSSGQAIAAFTNARSSIFYDSGGIDRLTVRSGGITVDGQAKINGEVFFDSIQRNGINAVVIDDILDEDNMASDSATALATQQSIKAYVDASAGTTYTAGTGITLTGTEFSIGQSVATTDSPTFAGLTTTADVSFGDSDKAIFGADSDLQIYHDGSNSFVRDAGTGNLRLQGTNLFLQNAGGTQNYLGAINNGAVTLYHDNAAKLATTSTGIDVTGSGTGIDLANFGGSAQTNFSKVNFNTDALSSQAYIIAYGSGNAESGNVAIKNTKSSGDIFFSVGNAERMRIPSSGAVTMTGNGCDIKWNANSNTTKARFINEGGLNDTWVGIGGYNGVNRLESGYGFSGGSADLMVYGGLSGELARITTSKRLGINNSSPAYCVDSTFPTTASVQQHWRFTGYYGGSQCRSYYGLLFIGGSSTAGHGIGISNGMLYPAEADNASFNNDNVMDLGYASSRWDDVYATNGTIQTSDEREKQDIEELSDAEQRVAVAAKGLLRKFRWKDAVEEKGDNARTHFGIIAQDLQAAFEAEGLDHSKYAMFIKSEWWIGDKTHPAIDEVLDDEGNVIVEGSPEHVETGHHYDNEADAPSDATYHYRLGIRYTELLAFIIASI